MGVTRLGRQYGMEGTGEIDSVRKILGRGKSIRGAGPVNVDVAAQEQYNIIVSDGPRRSLTENHRSYEPSLRA